MVHVIRNIVSFFLLLLVSSECALACEWRAELLNVKTKEVKYYKILNEPVEINLNEQYSPPNSAIRVDDSIFVLFVTTKIKCSIEPPKEYDKTSEVVVTHCAYPDSPPFEVGAFRHLSNSKTQSTQPSSVAIFGRVGNADTNYDSTYSLAVRCVAL